VISDYPAEEVLENIQSNITRNIESRREKLAIGKVMVKDMSGAFLDDEFCDRDKESLVEFWWRIVCGCRGSMGICRGVLGGF